VRRAVSALARDLATLGIPLHVCKVPRFRDASAAVVRLMRETGAVHLHFNAEYPLNEVRRDRAVWRAVTRLGRGCTRHEGSMVLPPGRVLTAAGRPFTVYTPFRRRWLSALEVADLTPVQSPRPVAAPIAPLPMCWDAADERSGAAAWPADSRTAQAQLHRFVARRLVDYGKDRDFPGVEGTSRLSPHLAAGTISPRQCLQAASLVEPVETSAWGNEIIWREFYRHVVAQHPHVSMGASFHRHYDGFRWERDPAALEAWKSGQTGYPLVDAAMRQLTSTGWMHNRLRMVSAMFLTKHLLIDWREGERFFMEQLVDADFASNNGGWQWSASTGTDAAPYFRVFNPATQGQRFDPGGTFTRLLVPELAKVPDRWLFEPWRAPSPLNYPPPIVDHALARQRAIDRFRGFIPDQADGQPD
jgi:deoxyribodipyrimidine photo-lyase